MGIFDLLLPNVEKMKAKKDVEGLIKALRYKMSWLVRMDAADALGKIGDRKAVRPLAQALKHRHKCVRQPAKRALEKIKAKKS